METKQHILMKAAEDKHLSGKSLRLLLQIMLFFKPDEPLTYQYVGEHPVIQMYFSGNSFKRAWRLLCMHDYLVETHEDIWKLN